MDVIEKNIVKNILECVPHKAPFRFIDDIEEVNPQAIRGNYTYRTNEPFYRGHFPDSPVTPGVILTETMAQIGLVAFGIYLSGATVEDMQNIDIFFTSSHINFYRVVLPKETVYVDAKKVYFRMKRIKCEAEMTSAKGELICKGTISGLFAERK